MRFAGIVIAKSVSDKAAIEIAENFFGTEE
jgi:hypothetical protein